MSWNLFKVNMLLYMNNPLAVKTPIQFGAKLAMEYDACMRRGGELIGKNSILLPNLPLMNTLMGVSTSIAITKQIPGQHSFINDIGKAVVGYWTGATLQPFPITPIPAPGSIQNIIINQSMVLDPGKFPKAPFEIPTDNCLIFINALVLFMQIHLFTIKGMYFTTSMYPGLVPTPAPGVVNWQGYNIPNIPFFGLGTPDNRKSDKDGGMSGNSLRGDFVSGNNGNVNRGDNNDVSIDSPSNSTSEDKKKIDDELKTKLNTDGTLSDKMQAILDAETEKSKLGLLKFYDEAQLNLGKLTRNIPNTPEAQSSVDKIRLQLEADRNKCCDDC